MAWTVDIEEYEIGIMRYDLAMLHGGLDENTGRLFKGRKRRLHQDLEVRVVSVALTGRAWTFLVTAPQEPDVYNRKMPCIGVGSDSTSCWRVSLHLEGTKKSLCGRAEQGRIMNLMPCSYYRGGSRRQCIASKKDIWQNPSLSMSSMS